MNDYIHNNKFAHSNSIIKTAKDELNMICQCNPSLKTQHFNLHQIVMHAKWRKPPYGVHKVNWDATFDCHIDQMGVGVIIRNHERNFVGALKATQPHLRILLL